MVWTQKSADTINKFSTEKERKKDTKTPTGQAEAERKKEEQECCILN